MRTIVAGSRSIGDYAMLTAAIQAAPWKPSVILSGGAEGVDRLGEQWARENGIPLEAHKGSMGEVVKKAEALLALWDGKSQGTRNMIGSASRAALRIFVMRSDRPWNPRTERMRPDANGPRKFMRCSCGRKFYVDDATGENLRMHGGVKIEVCPRCGSLNHAKAKGMVKVQASGDNAPFLGMSSISSSDGLPSVFVAAATFNRPIVSRMCLEQQASVMPPSHELHVWDDQSDRPPDLHGIRHIAHKEKGKLWVGGIRAVELLEFISSGFDVVYLTDCDAVLDPAWMGMAVRLLKYGEVAGLYNNSYNLRYVVGEGSEPPHYVKTAVPGISIMMVRAAVMRLVKILPTFDVKWDHRFSAELGMRCIVSKQSHCDHYGASGLHPGPGEWDKNVAHNPTPYLADLRRTLFEEIKAAAPTGSE
jgi:hypothetical protein